METDNEISNRFSVSINNYPLRFTQKMVFTPLTKIYTMQVVTIQSDQNNEEK